ncbi:MAG: hypothetical protein E7070_05100 [Bacteroidales bacterium]|nr:hypothetical protein [Bacteroidales bacterium]
MTREDIQAAMKAVVQAHRAIDDAGLYLRATRLEPQWQALWSAMDALQAELIAEKVRMGIDGAKLPRRPRPIDN